MENLRNHGELNDQDLASAPDYNVYEEDDGAVEAPPAIGQDERRMHVRAYNFWAGLLGERQFPSVEDLEPESDDDFGPNSVLLDFTDGFENPTIQFLGRALRDECEIDDSITSIADVPARSLLSRITDHYLQIIANQAPIGFEAEFVNQRGITIMYRGILLPFSTDDDTIDFIYGVINWKEVAADAVRQEIEDEVSEAMLAAPAKIAAGPVWDDGPHSTYLDEFELTSELELALDDSANAVAEPLDEEASLADWLCAARNSADDAADCVERSRVALYSAISQAYDFYLMTEQYPDDYRMLLEDSGLTVQDRAPMTPIVKLVFGAQYDKTRLTEYATALKYADRNAIEKGALGNLLRHHDGGLKAIVHAEREANRPTGLLTKARAVGEDLLAKLRSAPSRQLQDIEAGDSEFVVLVARKDANGDLAIVGPVRGNDKLTGQALKHTQF
ncbi:hypothetical protein [uncultured Parasphingorhabdus sp.]|uniref:PAS domain-containing protein n=1 Tax=uncultured Parasphingorhabdus sp. TaxID=2709694 RepID=UPI0030DACDF1|tara:strand:- start:5081 stop:6418 length:1338 start_codon:yes stop_codon:yes gene_type:complete